MVVIIVKKQTNKQTNTEIEIELLITATATGGGINEYYLEQPLEP